MPACGNCGQRLTRSHRSAFQKLFYSHIYRCSRCQFEAVVPRHWVLYLSLQARCPKCGTKCLDIRSKADKVDSIRKTPASLIARLLGGALYCCSFCRLQFYDLRKRAAVEIDRQNQL